MTDSELIAVLDSTTRIVVFGSEFSDELEILRVPVIERVIVREGFTGSGGNTNYALSAGSLSITRIASEAILKGDAVCAIDANTVGVANSNTTLQRAMCLGVALNDAVAGATVDILIMGVFTDSSLSIFTVNKLLMLDHNGGISDQKPMTGFRTIVGRSLGGNQILVNVQVPEII
jgi:hypothetical protein